MINGKRRSISEWWDTQERRTGHGAANAGSDVAAETVAGRVFATYRASPGSLGAGRSGPLSPPNYIKSLLAARDLNAIRFDMVLQPPPRTLLYLLLRHSMLLEYAAAGSRLLIRRGLLQPAQRREPELVDIPLGIADGVAPADDQNQCAGGGRADGAWQIPARLHAHGRTRRESRTRPQTAERIPRQPGAPENARVRTGSKSCWPARLISARTGWMRGSPRLRRSDWPRCARRIRPACCSAATAG